MSDIPAQPEETEEDHLHPQPYRGDQEAEYAETHEKAAKETRSE
jgi:hypothetical protein